MFVLDTNTLIYFFKRQGNVAEKLLNTAPRDIRIPSVVLYELETGIAKSSNPAKRRGQLDAVLSVVAILAFDDAEARAAAAIRAEMESRGEPIGPMDILIGATALTSGGTLVTRNSKEFRRISGLRTTDWYQ
jgi:tRNA(fMet)-specific endonuclease VapC